MSKQLLKITNLEKVYNDEEVSTQAVSGLSLTVDEGEFVALMGASGSGKSTLLHIIGGMDRATSGEYYFDGKAVHSMTTEQLHTFRGDYIGFVFQNFALMKFYTVSENIEIPLLIQNVPKKERRERIDDIMRRLHIEELANKKVTHISGGQQARTAIARAMVGRPKLLLADEPTGTLDKKTGTEIMNVFSELHAAGTTIVMVTHDPDVAAYADRTARMEDGRIIML